MLPENQLTIATKNWMLPAIAPDKVTGLPTEFNEMNRFLSKIVTGPGHNMSDAIALWRQHFRLSRGGSR